MDNARQQDFECTYRTYRNLMYHIAYQILQNSTDAEDAVAESFYKIFRNYSCLVQPAGPQTKRFVAVVTERTALNFLRSRKHFTDQPWEDFERVEAADTLSEEAIDLWVSLRRLPPDYRTAILLSCYCGLTAKEAAAVMNFSESKVKKLISRGKEKLKQHLEGSKSNG